MSRVSTRTLALVLSLGVLTSGVHAQTKPDDAVGTKPDDVVGTNALDAYPISTADWSAVLAAPVATVVAVTTAGSCVCDLTEGACDGNCCCDTDCSVRSFPRRRVDHRVVSYLI